MSNDTEQEDTIYEKALEAASEAFQSVLNNHFGRTFDGSPEDEARLMDEYRSASSADAVLHLRTGLVDADFACWKSGLADQNFT